MTSTAFLVAMLLSADAGTPAAASACERFRRGVLGAAAAMGAADMKQEMNHCEKQRAHKRLKWAEKHWKLEDIACPSTLLAKLEKDAGDESTHDDVMEIVFDLNRRLTRAGAKAETGCDAEK